MLVALKRVMSEVLAPALWGSQHRLHFSDPCSRLLARIEYCV